VTVIAWDGKTLAADKLLDCNGYPGIATKIRRAPNGDLLGASGDSDACRAMMDWYMTGADPVKFPENSRAEDSRSMLLVITTKREICMYARTPYPIVHEGAYFAIGSGGSEALEALYLGCDARKAVEVASALDVSCGNGMDTLEID
jgi:hypothetical protein